MKYKLLVTDIDRTFANQYRIFPENIEYLKELKKKNIILVANTGRGLKSGKFIIDLNIFDYFIGNDGAFIYDLNKKELIFRNCMKKKEVNKLLKIGNKHKMPWVIETMKEVYFSDVPETHSKDFLSYSTYPYKYTNYIDEDVNRILFMLSYKHSKDFMAEFPNFPILTNDKFNCFWNQRTLEITNKNVSKGDTLLVLLNKLNIKPSQILAIGDSANDRGMLKLTQMSVAMKNSDSIILEVANYITDSEENNGWLKGIKHYE